MGPRRAHVATECFHLNDKLNSWLGRLAVQLSVKVLKSGKISAKLIFVQICSFHFSCRAGLAQHVLRAIFINCKSKSH